MGFDIQNLSTAGFEVVHLSGRLILGEATEKFRALTDSLAAGQQGLVLNFKGVNYIDSAGLGELVGLKARADQLGIPVRLASATSRTIDLLRLSRLSTLFVMDEDVAQSLSQLGLS